MIGESAPNLEAPPSWEDIVALLIGAAIIVVVLPTLGAWLRGAIVNSSDREQGALHAVFSTFEHSLGHLHAGMLFLVFVASVFLVVLTLGRGHVLEGLALATGLTLFAGLHIPHLLPPAVHISVSVSNDGVSPSGYSDQADLREDTETLLFFRVTNTGACHYKDCTLWIWFPDEVTVVREAQRYHDIDFRKDFSFQRGGNCLCFHAGLDLTPGNHAAFPVLVSAPNGRFKAQIEVETESRWGATKKAVAIIA